jgi:putative hemolysin
MLGCSERSPGLGVALAQTPRFFPSEVVVIAFRAAALGAALLLSSWGSAAAAAQQGPDVTDINGAAAAYCVASGGVVEHRRPVYGSNGPSLLFLAGPRDFCQFTLPSDGSRIHVLLLTLYTTSPSLAALAYYAAPKLHTHHNGGNPASYYCSQLGGSDLFGGKKDASGGGWYLKGAIDETLEACIFPDMSSIDSWGLAYHSAGIIRGIDLSTVLRYKGPPKQARGK